MKLSARTDTLLGAYLLGIILGGGAGLAVYAVQVEGILQVLILSAVAGFLAAYSIFGFWAIITGRWEVSRETIK